MGTTWKCHYRKNKPGYPNQWEQCTGEVQHMLLCSDPLMQQAIDVVGAIYYLPLGSLGALYRNVSGYFVATGTTGTTPVPVSHANVHVQLSGYDTYNVGWILFSGDFTANNSGAVSGFFPCSGVRTMAGVSGFASYVSGNLTGLTQLNNSVTDIPYATFDIFETSATGHTVRYDVMNQIDATITVSVQRAPIIDPFNFSNVYTTTLTGLSATSAIQTQSIPTGSGYYYRTSYVPQYSSKAVESPNQTGGAPPIPTGLSLFWSGIPSPTFTPYLRVGFASGYADLYDDMAIEYKETGSSSWNSLSSPTKYDTYYLSDISSLTGDYYNFKASGCHFDSFSTCFYSPILSGVINIRAIQLAIGQSISGCGLDLLWKGQFGGPYDLYIALDNGMSVGLNIIAGITTNFYHHDTSGSCGQLYYYQVKEGSLSSNIVSGSGNYIPPVPAYTLSQYGTSGILINWSAMTDPQVEYLSGSRSSINYTGTAVATNSLLFPFTGVSGVEFVPLNAVGNNYIQIYLFSVKGTTISSNAKTAGITIVSP